LYCLKGLQAWTAKGHTHKPLSQGENETMRAEKQHKEANCLLTGYIHCFRPLCPSTPRATSWRNGSAFDSRSKGVRLPLRSEVIRPEMKAYFLAPQEVPKVCGAFACVFCIQFLCGLVLVSVAWIVAHCCSCCCCCSMVCVCVCARVPLGKSIVTTRIPLSRSSLFPEQMIDLHQVLFFAAAQQTALVERCQPSLSTYAFSRTYS
jgi:hypothetical protein